MPPLHWFTNRILLLSLLLQVSNITRSQTVEIDKYFETARVAVEKDDYAGAVIPLKIILQKDEANIRALEGIIFAYDKLKNYSDAAVAAIRLTEIQPENSNYYSSAGWFLMLDKKYTRSEKYLLEALSLNDCSYNNYLNLGHLYAFLKKKKQCQEYYKKAASYIPNKDAYENSILKDFDFFKQQGDYPYNTDIYKNMFQNYFTTQYVKKEFGSNILDSLYHLTTDEKFSINDPVIIALKEKFIKEEQKNPQMRTYVLRDFYWSLGWLHFNTGSRNKAMGDYFINVIKISNDLKDTAFVIDVLYKMGIANNEGMPLVVQALGLANLTGDTARQYILNLILGDKLREKQEADSALYYYRKNYSLGDNIEGNPDAAYTTLNRMMLTFGQMQVIDSVSRYYDLAKRFHSTREYNAERSLTDDIVYCVVLRQSGMYEACITNAKKFIGIYQKQNIDLSQLYENTGLAYNMLNRKDSAYFYLSKAITLYNQFIREKPGEDHDYPYKERFLSYIFLKRITLESNDVDKYFDLSEQCKANILYNKLTGSKYPPATITIPAVEKGLASDELVISYVSSGLPNSGAAIAISRDKTLLIKENHELLQKLLRSHSEVDWDAMMNKIRLLAHKSSPALTADEIKSSVDLMGVVAFSLNNRMFGALNSRGISTDGEKTRNEYEEMKAYNDIMYNLFLMPFEKMLEGKKTIYISPDLLTTLVPFETLQNREGKYLGELYNIIYVPSLTSRNILKNSGKDAGKKMLAVGNADYSAFDPHSSTGRAYDLSGNGTGGWKNLPGTAKELLSIQKNVPSVVILDKGKLTESSIKSLSLAGELEKYDILHFAVHGMASKSDYKDNAIIISEKPRSVEDGFLLFNEIADLKINAGLVCLSACETALALPSEDEEPKNLPVAFFLAGAKSVIATWWKIDDEGTGIFMNSFYDLVFKHHNSYSEALFLTRKKFINGEMGEKYKDPYYWAAFKYFGY
jgi:CHAT domain-containing protein/tetratricopeptide (TPR) repeat protein